MAEHAPHPSQGTPETTQIVGGLESQVAPRMLDLFTGTGSVAQAFRSRGYAVTTLDLDPRAAPDILADVLQWDYTTYPPGYFDVIFAAPPCTE